MFSHFATCQMEKHILRALDRVFVFFAWDPCVLRWPGLSPVMSRGRSSPQAQLLPGFSPLGGLWGATPWFVKRTAEGMCFHSSLDLPVIK